MAIHSLSQSLTDGTVESWQSTVFPSPQLMGQWNHGSPLSPSQSLMDGTMESWQSTVFPSPQQMGQWNHGSPHSLSQSSVDETVESWQSTQSFPVLNGWDSGIMAVHTVFHSPQWIGQWNHDNPQSFPVFNRRDSGIMAIHTVFPSPQQMGQCNHGSPHSLSQSSTDGTVESWQSTQSFPILNRWDSGIMAVHTVFPSPQSMRQWNHGSPQSVPVLNRWYS